MREFEQPVQPEEFEVQIQVLQHGHFPVENDTVTVVATLGDKRLEQTAQPQVFAEHTDTGHASSDHTDSGVGQAHHQRGANWPEGHEPGYVAVLNLTEPGRWEVMVQSAWPPLDGHNPSHFAVEVARGSGVGHGTGAGTGGPPTGSEGASWFGPVEDGRSRGRHGGPPWGQPVRPALEAMGRQFVQIVNAIYP